MKVLIINQSSIRTPRKFIDLWCGQIEKELLKSKIMKSSHQKMQLTVVFLNAPAAKKINLQFRGRNYATDVLSFDPMEPDSLGELVLCPQVLQRQAKEHKLNYQLELGYMVLHGILHLLGYDHETSDRDAKKMFAIQDRIFANLGV
ncbi:MAG: rRNA maturation RNase YbeY [Bdellovibrionaceae bacterium]|nr:rRNA maturation RNase YbeY [Pseudobdellovibrionaceae bacterium]